MTEFGHERPVHVDAQFDRKQPLAKRREAIKRGSV
jgi:hypothetical protein